MTPKTKSRGHHKGGRKRDEASLLDHEATVRFIYEAKALRHFTLDQITDLVKRPVEAGGLGKVIARSTVYNYLREGGIERVSQQPPTDQQRVAAVEHIDYLIQEAHTMVPATFIGPEGNTLRRPEANRISAINLVARLEEQKANLLGTKAPVQIEAKIEAIPNVDLELVKMLEERDIGVSHA